MRSTLLSLGLILVLAHVTGPAGATTPAERKVAAARDTIAQSPERAEGHARLAMALIERARETSDTTFHAAAEEAIARSLERAPGNLDARRAAIRLLLGRHAFADALAAAQTLRREAPDDFHAYAYLTDAQVELGHYREAERSAQRLLDLRPGTPAALTRAAYLRELGGDVGGSLDLMQQAYERTAPDDVEARAWILVQMAHLHLLDRNVAAADALARAALRSFPDYHYALAQQARVREAQGRLPEAIALLRRHVEIAAHPENLFYLGEALARDRQTEEAAAVFARFEAAARAESASWDNANRELIRYYADHAGRPADALALARFENARRQDVWTLDAHAWALYRMGRFNEADAIVSRALATGVRDAGLQYHAGMIALRRGADARARAHLKAALRDAPQAAFAADARAALDRARKPKQPV